MKKLNLLTSLTKRKGVVQMKNLLIVVAVALLLVPACAFADISIGVSGSITGGTSLTQGTLYQCTGWKLQGRTDVNPAVDCVTATTLSFGSLVKDLKNTAGVVTAPAGCFYAEPYFVVYLFPDAWGGKSYELRQKSATVSNTAVASAMQMTPVYAAADSFRWPDNTFHAQGALTSTEVTANPQINRPVLAASSPMALILKTNRARIVRAEYGIPPFPGTGETRAPGFVPVPLTTSAGAITGTVVFSLTEI